MQLHSLNLRAFKKFSELNLDFSSTKERCGQLILVTGANEAGKSTLSDALRFALVGTSRSGALAAKLRPKFSPQAAPELRLQFSHAGREFDVRKKLAERGETTLTLRVDGIESISRHDAAEILLQQFFAGAKTPRKASLSGLPQALWMTQGEFEAPALDGSADSTLRDALSAALGQMLGKAEIWRQQIETELRSMEGARGPIGDYRKLLSNHNDLSLAHQKASAQLADFSNLLAEYAALCQLLQSDPELNSLAEQQLQLDALRIKLQGLQRQQLVHVRAKAEYSSLQTQLHVQTSTLKQLELDQTTLHTNLQNQAALASECEAQSAEQALLAARKIDEEAALQRLVQRKKTAQAQLVWSDWQQLDAAYQRAKEQGPRDTPLRQAARSALKLALDSHKTLAQEIALSALHAGFVVQLAPIASGWQLERAGVLEALHANDPQTLTSEGEALRLRHPDGSTIQIESRQRGALHLRESQQQRLQALLGEIKQNTAALGFPETPSDALAALEQDTLLRAEAGAIRDEAKRAAKPLQARLGLSTLPTPSEVKLALNEAARALAALNGAASDSAAPVDESHALVEANLSEQRSALNLVNTELARASERGNYLAKRTLELQAQAQSIMVDASAITQAQFAIAEIQEQMQAVQSQVALTQADAHSFEALQSQLDSAIVRQRQSTQLHNAQSAKKQELQGRLRGVGQQDLHRQEAELASQLNEASSLVESQTRRFEALKHLLNLFNGEKAAFEARISEPLNAKLAPYLLEVFGAGADVLFNAELQPELLARGEGGFKPSELSLGTREQLAVLVRIAYADVLAEAGYPTLLILDDVLNFSDVARRSRLMRVIEGAAARHCIVLMSCNHAHWHTLQFDHQIDLDSVSAPPKTPRAIAARTPVAHSVQAAVQTAAPLALAPEPGIVTAPSAKSEPIAAAEPALCEPLIEPNASAVNFRQIAPAENLLIVHGQKLETLALALWERIDAYRHANPMQVLKPLEVIVGHIGMARWLKYALAKRAGIAANIEFMLPSEWVERTLQSNLPSDAGHAKRFHTDSLRLAIYQLLRQPERYGLAPELVADPRNRYALAERMAVRFTQYLVYRSDWLLALEAGSTPRQSRSQLAHHTHALPAEEFAGSWQAALWLALVGMLGSSHRGQRRQALLQQFDIAPAQPNAPLFCFGLNQLAPDDLALLRGYARAASVVIFFPNPCQEYWADLQTRPKLQNAFRSAADLEDDFGLDLGHPLLSALGKHGQMLFTQLSDCSDQFFEIDWAAPEQPSALQCLQIGINELTPDLKSAANISDSIQIVAADSALSELEAIAERLHACFSADASLALEDVVVMAPNISCYAPLLAFAFAQKRAADGSLLRPAIPYSVLDTNPLQQPVLQRLLLILKLPTVVFDFDILMQCLALPELMQRFGIDESLLTLMQSYLEKGYFESGFNGKDWADQLGLEEQERASLSINTLDNALTRLWLGYWMGRESEAIDGDFPVPELDSAAYSGLSRLSVICAELRLFSTGSRVDRTPSAWASWISERIDAMLDFAADPDNSAVLAGRSLLSAAIDAWVERTQPLNLSPLPYCVVLAELERALFASHWPSERLQPQQEQGGVVCCGMVPMRTLPYKIICVLGLQQGEFPRRQPPDSTDWLRKPGLARLGDRNTRAEDNYLLIEALLAARDKLFLSYVAIDVSTGLAGEACAALAAVIKQLQHMCNPGEPDFSFASNLPALASSPLQAKTPAAVRIEMQPAIAASSAQKVASPLIISLDSLIGFWKNPTRYFLNTVLQAATPFEAFEPEALLSTRTAPNEFIETALVQNALAAGWLARPSWLMQSGKISADALGMAKLAQACAKAEATWHSIMQSQPALLESVPSCELARCEFTDSEGAAVQLHGVIGGVFRQQRLLLQLNGKGANAHDAIALQIKLALLQIQFPEHSWRGYLPNHLRLLELIEAPINPRGFLSAAVDGMRKAQQMPLLFWPKLALQYAFKPAKNQAEITPAALLKFIYAEHEYEFSSADNQLLLSALGLQQRQLEGTHALAFFDAQQEHWQQFQHWSNFWFAAYQADES